MTFLELCKWGEKRLADAGVADAGLDARYLLLEAFELDMAHFLLKQQEQVPTVDGRTREAIQARAMRVPLQYLVGSQEFMGLSFQVDSRVLIPRQDTETLVEMILKEHPEKETRILDLCTGSGCIAISLAALGGYGQVDGADISGDALEVARENGRRLAPAVRFLEGDLFEALDEGAAYDVIASNPPYIATEVIEGLEPEVRDYEPRGALDGGADGLTFYRRLAAECREHLTDGGSVYFEIGCEQAADVTGFLADAGYSEIEVIKDEPGLDRVVRAVYRYAGGLNV